MIRITERPNSSLTDTCSRLRGCRVDLYRNEGRTVTAVPYHVWDVLMHLDNIDDIVGDPLEHELLAFLRRNEHFSSA